MRPRVMLIKPFTMKMTAVGISLFMVFYLGFYILYYRILLTGLGREELLSDLGVRELTFNKFIFAVLCISVALMLTGIFGILKAVIKNAAAICFDGGKIRLSKTYSRRITLSKTSPMLS